MLTPSGLVLLCAILGQQGLCMDGPKEVCIKFIQTYSDEAGTYLPEVIPCPSNTLTPKK